MIKYTEQKGSFFKPCPCSPETISCGYFNLNLHTGCQYSCSYCILQGYLNNLAPVFFTNFDNLKLQLVELCKNRNYLRIGTGELSDSLVYDNKTKYSLKILSWFEEFPEVVFEFKTKSTNINNIIMSEQVLKNIVISWSLNPEEIITTEESGTPSLILRLQALEKVQTRGYKIGIHFDPIIYVNDWKRLYANLIEKISTFIDPESLVWISLGALRFPHSLRDRIFKHKKSKLFQGELIKGYDGKYRYFKPLRIELFKYIKEKIRTFISSEIPLYLCMEDHEAWEEVFPEIKPNPAEINRMLYLSVFKNG